MFQKKSLGQNFLTSTRALREIIEASDIHPEDTVLEIGPGDGALTQKILESKPKQVIVVEKDDRLIPILEERFKKNIDAGELKIIHADILDELEKGIDFSDKSFKIIANIPYYITGLIIRRVFSLKSLPERVILLVQKEVADRMVTRKKIVYFEHAPPCMVKFDE
jgi:16S rRNA (adenine1518-N6/adenine1519-N6)-dimethyltransferase